MLFLSSGSLADVDPFMRTPRKLLVCPVGVHAPRLRTPEIPPYWENWTAF